MKTFVPSPITTTLSLQTGLPSQVAVHGFCFCMQLLRCQSAKLALAPALPMVAVYSRDTSAPNCFDCMQHDTHGMLATQGNSQPTRKHALGFRRKFEPACLRAAVCVYAACKPACFTPTDPAARAGCLHSSALRPAQNPQNARCVAWGSRRAASV